jgi:hypothetical protein
MSHEDEITLTKAEAEALYGLMDMLSGCNAGNVFAWDGTDDRAEPTVSACAKVFSLAGKPIPDNLKQGKAAP